MAESLDFAYACAAEGKGDLMVVAVLLCYGCYMWREYVCVCASIVRVNTLLVVVNGLSEDCGEVSGPED